MDEAQEIQAERAAQKLNQRGEGRLSLFASIGFLVLTIVSLAAGLTVFIPSTQAFPPLDDAIISNSEFIVVIGRDVRDIDAEVHLQPQEADEFPDGATLMISELMGTPDTDASDSSTASSFVVAIPRSRANDSLADWETSDGECSQRREIKASDLPSPARSVANDHLVVQFDECDVLSLDLETAAPDIYLTDPYSTALRFPPVAIFDQSDEVVSPEWTEFENEDGTTTNDRCKNTTVLLETYQLKATDWLGAHPANIIAPLRRTQATYYGGTFERPQAWVANERIPESGTGAPCVTQGIGIDFDRPASLESKTRDQVLAGFLVGLASAFLIAGLESAFVWVRYRRNHASQ